MAYELTEQQKAGVGLIGFGIVFTFLGVVLFFDRGLLALGNILWLTGVALLLGWRSTLNIFASRANYKGSASFLLGLFFIFVRWPVLGILLEIYSCIVLFGLVFHMTFRSERFLVLCKSFSLSNSGDWLDNTVPILILDRLQRALDDNLIGTFIHVLNGKDGFPEDAYF